MYLRLQAHLNPKTNEYMQTPPIISQDICITLEPFFPRGLLKTDSQGALKKNNCGGLFHEIGTFSNQQHCMYLHT